MRAVCCCHCVVGKLCGTHRPAMAPRQASSSSTGMMWSRSCVHLRATHMPADRAQPCCCRAAVPAAAASASSWCRHCTACSGCPPQGWACCPSIPRPGIPYARLELLNEVFLRESGSSSNSCMACRPLEAALAIKLASWRLRQCHWRALQGRSGSRSQAGGRQL